jgi:septal ring-binding cell division protein DamX
MYFYGQGVQRNERVAYAWIGNAARQGYPPALDAVRALRSKQEEAARRAQEAEEQAKPYPPPAEPTPTVVLPPQSDSSDIIDLRPRSAAPPPVVLPEVPAAMLAEPAQPAPRAPQTQSAPPPTAARSEQAEPAPAAQYRDSAWVMDQPADVYTIQLLSGTSRDDALSFMNTHDMELEVALFDFARGGVQWYAVLYGVFPTLSKARAALQELSPELLAREPWIRAMESIHALRASP